VAIAWILDPRAVCSLIGILGMRPITDTFHASFGALSVQISQKCKVVRAGGGARCRNAGAVAAERAQVHREYMLRKQEALRNRARGRVGVLSPYVSCITLHCSTLCHKLFIMVYVKLQSALWRMTDVTK